MKQWPELPELQAREAELETALRLRREPRATATLSYAGNDYLGLADGSGAEASRLLGAKRADLDAFESELGDWLGGEPTVVGSGYQANMSVIGALIHPGDLVLSDAQNHASLVDAIRLTRADVVVHPHLDLEAALVAASAARTVAPLRRIWSVTESYFSMSAESPALAEWLPALAGLNVRTLLDESHAIGVFGPEGRGLAFAGDSPLPSVATFGLGKAFAGEGGVICGGRRLRQTLVNDARPIMFSTAPSPVAMAAMRRRLAQLRKADAARITLSAGAAFLREGLQSLGYTVLGHGHILPVLIGSETTALALSKRLIERGIDAPAIRYPTVAHGAALLRLNITANHSRDQHRAFLSEMRELG